MSDPAPELKTYHGNCHCAAFKYSVKLPELTSIMECNCSICSKKAYKWVFPSAGDFTIEKGDGTLKDYDFGKKAMAHMFCPTCGTGVIGRLLSAPEGRFGLNVRTINDVDLWSLKANKYDGKALSPQYDPPKFTGPEPAADIEGGKIYTGGCHCGDVTLAVKTKSLPELVGVPHGIMECNCSICSRNGLINIYPNRDQVSIVGSSNLTMYLFGNKHHGHKFCKNCGIPIYIDSFVGPAKEVYDTWPEAKQKQREQFIAYIPVNIRCLDGVEWDLIKTEKSNGSKFEPKYEVK